MQQKSHEILSGKLGESGSSAGAGEGEERQARRLLAAAEELSADWAARQDHHHHADAAPPHQVHYTNAGHGRYKIEVGTS